MAFYELSKVRTNNFTDPEMFKKITRVWEEGQVQLKEETTLYGVYHEFTSDYRGDYSLSIATDSLKSRVLSPLNPGGNYQISEVDLTQEMAVFQTWQTI